MTTESSESFNLFGEDGLFSTFVKFVNKLGSGTGRENWHGELKGALSLQLSVEKSNVHKDLQNLMFGDVNEIVVSSKRVRVKQTETETFDLRLGRRSTVRTVQQTNKNK
jgi:hypothetical protein